jgi:hydroxypyruvate reductase
MTRRGLEGALRRALARMDPRARVALALPRPPRRRSGDVPAVSIVAIGKAAPSMAAGALERWADAVADVIVVTSDGTDASAIEADERVEVLRAGHPIPDRRSVEAAARCLEQARWIAKQPNDGRLLLVLISGGASSLVCAPAPGLRLKQKQAVTRAMLASGASIQDINIVRKHLSRIKGGGLARAARPAPVMTLGVSDVIGGAIGDVGSGPGVGDRSSVEHARRLLHRYAPRFADLPLVSTGPANNVRFARVVCAPEDLAKTIASELRAHGLRVRVLEPSQAPVTKLAEEYGALARRLRRGTAIVRVAEPSIEVPGGAGRGGRSTHLAALVALDLPGGAMFLAAATDGVDGSSGTAGAIVDRRLVLGSGETAIRRALARYDTGALHVSAATALPLRPSGHNLADVHVLTMT